MGFGYTLNSKKQGVTRKLTMDIAANLKLKLMASVKPLGN